MRTTLREVRGAAEPEAAQVMWKLRNAWEGGAAAVADGLKEELLAFIGNCAGPCGQVTLASTYRKQYNLY